ncbi:MAG TPA: hypothetical protein VK912_10975 [Longimicrobiales bacterium]|nr:hypothetical protein [Longimicrobiales bacterium]
MMIDIRRSMRRHARGWMMIATMAVTAGCTAADSAPVDTTGDASLAAVSAAQATPVVAVSDAQPTPVSAPEPTLEEVRAATIRFRDVNVAIAEGYVRDPMDLCDTAEMMGRPSAEGVMGIHFARPDLLGITGPPNPRVTGNGTHTDFLEPSILIYEPQADGSLELVAVENLVFIDAWNAAGKGERPSFQGRPYDLMADDPATAVDEAHMFEPHYDLHVWLYRENPRGMFAQFNPNATCANHTGNAHSH